MEYRFDFTYPKASTQERRHKSINYFFEELLLYPNHNNLRGAIWLHTSDELGFIPTHPSVFPLTFREWTVGYFSFSDSSTLKEKDIEKIIRAIMNTFEILFEFLEQKKEASLDSLTWLINRKYMNENINTFFYSAQRNDQYASTLFLDLDHFKKINDTHGHGMGDTVLKKVSEVLRKTLRKNDIICRYGGEEFLIVTAHNNKQEWLEVAERLRIAVESIRIDTTNPSIRPTCSIGISTKKPDCSEESEDYFHDQITFADAALYQAKVERNCIRSAKKPD